MREFIRQLFSCVLIIALSIPSCSVFAADGDNEYVSQDNFFNWVAGTNGFFQKIVGYTAGSSGLTCAVSDDTYHHATSYQKDMQNGYYACLYSDKELNSLITVS